MATKPATAPRLWGTNALYTTGPFIGQPGKVDPGVGVAAEGHRPGAAYPTPAEFENYQQNRTTDWITNWLRLGTFSPDATAHVVETDSTGRAGLHGLDVIDTTDEIAVNISGVNTFVPTVLATCTTGATVIQSSVGNSDGTCYSGTLQSPSIGTVYQAGLYGALSGAAGLRVDTDLACGAPGVLINYNGIGRAARIVNTGPNVECLNIDSNASTTAMGIRVEVGGPTPAIQARSGPNSGSAVRAFLFNNVGAAVHATTPGTAVSGARAVLAAASGGASGVEAAAVGDPVAQNQALLLRMQAGTLAGSELTFLGRAGDSTSIGSGRINFNTVTGTFTVSDVGAGEQKDLWQSRGGSVVGGSANNSAALTNNNAALYTECNQLTLENLAAPRRAGVRVMLRFTCEVRSPNGNANGGIDVRLTDETVAPEFVIAERSGAGNLVNSNYLVPVATTRWQRTIVLDFRYTIPAAGNRTFKAWFRSNTADPVAIRDYTLVPFGAFT